MHDDEKQVVPVGQHASFAARQYVNCNPNTCLRLIGPAQLQRGHEFWSQSSVMDTDARGPPILMLTATRAFIKFSLSFLLTMVLSVFKVYEVVYRQKTLVAWHTRCLFTKQCCRK